MTEIINGNKIADRIRAELEVCIETLADHGVTSGLATLLMSDDSASETYVMISQRRIEGAEHLHTRENVSITI